MTATNCPRCGNLAANGELHCKKVSCGWIVCTCRAIYDPNRGTSYHPDNWRKR